MKLSGILKREMEVAFSKHAQPVWFRVVKYILLIGSLYLFWRSSLFWMLLAVFFILALFLHFWYRYKTQGWTKSYGMWNYDKNKPQGK